MGHHWKVQCSSCGILYEEVIGKRRAAYVTAAKHYSETRSTEHTITISVDYP